MKVRDLIEALNKVDADLEIYGYTEDEALVTQQHLFRVFFVDGTDVTSAETSRGDDGEPMLRFGSGEGARKLAFLNLTTDF